MLAEFPFHGCGDRCRKKVRLPKGLVARREGDGKSHHLINTGDLPEDHKSHAFEKSSEKGGERVVIFAEVNGLHEKLSRCRYNISESPPQLDEGIGFFGPNFSLKGKDAEKDEQKYG